MFTSATLRLTAWYLLILMTISVIFSVAIYNLASKEVDERLSQLQTKIERVTGDLKIAVPLPDRLDYIALRNAQREEANQNLTIQLVYANLLVLALGGAGSYFLARRTLQPIEEAHEIQARFVSDASHELKTPLTAMKTEIEVALHSNDLSAAEMRELLESNLEEVNKLSNLSTTLLQLSQLDHSGLEKEELSLNSIIADASKKYDKSGSRIVFTPSKHRSSIHGNRPAIEELVTILMDNALKYSPRSSQIAIKTRRLKRGIQLSIANEGEGIKEEDLAHIFDRFYRGDTARTKNADVKGHGLGLALAKRIVEIHHGELTVSSAPKQKTTFIVILPHFPSKS